MKVKISWNGEARFLAEAESHHTVLMDGPPEHGGKNSGPRPMEMMLMGIGGCAAFDVVHILKKLAVEAHAVVLFLELQQVRA